MYVGRLGRQWVTYDVVHAGLACRFLIAHHNQHASRPTRGERAVSYHIDGEFSRAARAVRVCLTSFTTAQ